MTEIVKRLREVANDQECRFPLICDEAADEIERLTTEVNGYKHDVRRLLEGERHLQAEIERLRASDARFDKWHTIAAEQKAEIERLRAENAQLSNGITPNRYWEGRWRDEKAENERLRGERLYVAETLYGEMHAEIERLCAALVEIRTLGDTGHGPHQIASVAAAAIRKGE